MCGINGIFAYHDAAPPVDRRDIVVVRDAMAARGPDGAGEWIAADGRTGFGHRRLSILDLSPAGAQPMASSDGRFIITFNGEIYNCPELRRALETRGRIFRSTSDTEVLLHLYAEKGEAMMGDLRGMYAFAIWDRTARRLFMARDPYGIKPLYYADVGGRLHFASSVKALVTTGTVPLDPDPAGVVGFYLTGSVPEPFTTYRAIHCLPAGTTLTVEAHGAGEPVVFASVAQAFAAAERTGISATDGAIAAVLRDSFLDSVRHHLLADVPVGVFLSAGIDSGALVGLMRDAGASEIQSLTLTFDDFRHSPADEAPLAEVVARHYGTKHTTRRIGAREFQDDLPKIMAAMDQPSIDGINTWFVAKAAHEIGLKVALSGVGGDELLAGYHTFTRIPHLVQRARRLASVPGLAATMAAGVTGAIAIGLKVHPKAAQLLSLGRSYAGAYLLQRGLFMPPDLGEVIADPEFIARGLAGFEPVAALNGSLRYGQTSAYAKVGTLESCWYLRNQLLRDTDWAGMAHSLEIRTPLVDFSLLRAVAPVLAANPPQSGKLGLATSASVALPDVILKRPKSGFGIPVQAWAEGMLSPHLGGGIHRRDDRLWPRTWARQIMSQDAQQPGSVETRGGETGGPRGALTANV